MQFATQPMALGFLHLQHVIGQFLGLKLDGAIGTADAVPDRQECHPVEQAECKGQVCAED
jgi:hypothetical protein